MSGYRNWDEIKSDLELSLKDLIFKDEVLPFSIYVPDVVRNFFVNGGLSTDTHSKELDITVIARDKSLTPKHKLLKLGWDTRSGMIYLSFPLDKSPEVGAASFLIAFFKAVGVTKTQMDAMELVVDREGWESYEMDQE